MLRLLWVGPLSSDAGGCDDDDGNTVGGDPFRFVGFRATTMHSEWFVEGCDEADGEEGGHAAAADR